MIKGCSFIYGCHTARSDTMGSGHEPIRKRRTNVQDGIYCLACQGLMAGQCFCKKKIVTLLGKVHQNLRKLVIAGFGPKKPTKIG